MADAMVLIAGRVDQKGEGETKLVAQIVERSRPRRAPRRSGSWCASTPPWLRNRARRAPPPARRSRRLGAGGGGRRHRRRPAPAAPRRGVQGGPPGQRPGSRAQDAFRRTLPRLTRRRRAARPLCVGPRFFNSGGRGRFNSPLYERVADDPRRRRPPHAAGHAASARCRASGWCSRPVASRSAAPHVLVRAREAARGSAAWRASTASRSTWTDAPPPAHPGGLRRAPRRP